MTIPPDSRVELLDATVEVLGDGSAAAIPVRDGDVSMRPTLRAGQLLWVVFAEAQPRTGDIILFRQQDYLVVHRLLGHARFPDGRPSLRTRGDGWNRLDPHLDPQRVVGRVVAFRDDSGWWDFEGTAARTYARAVAWHNLFWAAVGSAAGVPDRVLLRRPTRGPLRGTAALLDRGLLAVAHALFFRLAHARREAPCDVGATSPAAILHDR